MKKKEYCCQIQFKSQQRLQNHKNRTKGLIKLILQLNHVEKSIYSNINSEITILVSIRNEFYLKKIKKVFLPSSYQCMFRSIFSWKFIQNQLNTFILFLLYLERKLQTPLNQKIYISLSVSTI